MHTSPALFSRKFIPPFSVLLIGLIALLVKCWDLLLQRSETAPCNVYLPALAEVICSHSTWRGTAASRSHWAPMESGMDPVLPRHWAPKGVDNKTCWNHVYLFVMCVYLLLCVFIHLCQCDCRVLANAPNHTSGTTSSAFESFTLIFQNFPCWCYSDARTSVYVFMYMCVCIIYTCLWAVYKPTQRLLVQWELLLLQTCAHCLVQEPQDAFHWCLLKSKHSCENCNNQVAFWLLVLVFFSSYCWMAVLALLSVQCEMLSWCCCSGAHCVVQGCWAPQSFRLLFIGAVLTESAPTAQHHFPFAEQFLPALCMWFSWAVEKRRLWALGVVAVSGCAERSVCV